MQEPFQEKHDMFLTIENWQRQFPGLLAGFSTRREGHSLAPFKSNNLGLHVGDDENAVHANREKLAQALGVPLANWVFAQQIHGNHIQRITRCERGSGVRDYASGISATDGLFTKEKGIVLALAFADCVPLYFYSPRFQLVGVAHAGWRGTVRNIAGKMIASWRKEGIPPEEVFVVIGPAICRSCYRVDARVIREVKKLPVAADLFYQEVDEKRYTIDLKNLNRALLQYAGIPAGNIQVSGLCTSCREHLFFSHRRDSGKMGNTGRMLAFIGIKEDG